MCEVFYKDTQGNRYCLLDEDRLLFKAHNSLPHEGGHMFRYYRDFCGYDSYLWYKDSYYKGTVNIYQVERSLHSYHIDEIRDANAKIHHELLKLFNPFTSVLQFCSHSHRLDYPCT